MKRFDSGEALAKEMGISPAYLKKTFETYNAGAKAKKDPFGKKVITTDSLPYLLKLIRFSSSSLLGIGLWMTTSTLQS